MNTSKTLEICSNLNNILEQYGNINFLSKDDLYSLIDYIRNCFEIKIDEIFNVVQFCQNNFSEIINYDFHKFNDKKIGGFLIKNTFPVASYITVNSSKELESVAFDLTHEMMHFLLHPENRKYYISSSLCDIDNFEWQANERAAELLVPYKHFIPLFTKNIKHCTSKMDYIELLNYLSDKYKVSTAVLEYRISGLKYEINQYENGTPIDKIQFLSKRAQEEQGIFIKSYSEIFNTKKIKLKSIISQFPISHSLDKQICKLELATSSPRIENWNDFLNYLKSSGKIMLYTNLFNTELLPINKNTVGINFINGFTSFNKTTLKRESNIKLIETQIHTMFHKKMNIKFIDKSTSIVDIETYNNSDDLPF